MKNNDKNRWVIILGGSSGLGLATAKKLSKHKYNIIIVHRDRRSDLEEIASHINEITLNGSRCVNFNIDALNTEKRTILLEEIKNTIGAEGKIAALIHSIAKGNLKPMHAEGKSVLSHQDFEITIDAMALSLYDWTKMLIDAQIFASDTRIISFTSEGNTKAWQNYAAVSAAKAALEAITRNIALEFASIGIKANCIQAGMTDTRSFQMIPGSEELQKHAIQRNPNKRMTTPEDVANVVYLLCKQEAEWITGTVIKVDGGESLR